MPLVTVVGTNESGAASASFNVTVAEAGPNPADYDQIIEGESFPNGISLDGVTDRAYVRCRIGSMFEKRNCHHILIQECERIGGLMHGFRLRETGAPCSDIIYHRNKVRNIARDGFSSSRPDNGAPHTMIQIIENTIDNIGLDQPGGGLLHGIYSFGEAYIARNKITRCVGGNGVSLRGGGVIEGNFIADCLKGGATYYGDHPAGPSNRMIIRGNAITIPNPASSYADITLLGVPNASFRVDNFDIYDNTITRPLLIGSGYGGAVFMLSPPDKIRTDAQVRALFPAG